MKYGTPPRNLPLHKRALLKLTSRPKWSYQSDSTDLDWFFNSTKDLKNNGIIVPGTFIQANSMLFEPGDDDHPGELLFSLSADADVIELRQVAESLFMWKGENSPDPEESFFSAYLANELKRVLGVKLSEKICPIPDTYVSTTVFYRDSFPNGVLDSASFPILVSPETFAAVVLPYKFWNSAGHDLYNTLK